MRHRGLLVALLLVLTLVSSGCLEGLGDGGSTEISITTATPIPSDGEGTGEGDGVGLQSRFVELYDETIPSVVSVTVYGGSPGAIERGTGFVYDLEGHIVTNQHVVSEGGDVEVTFSDGVTVEAEVVGTSLYNDLAVLKVEPAEHALKPLPLGNSSELREGMTVLALGNPLGYEGSMSHGIVSALGRTMGVQRGFSIPGVIQTDAPINPGNSGGPLITLQGEVVGVNRAKAQADNIGFAIPSNIAKRVVPILIEEGRYRYPWIGIRTIEVTPDVAREMGLDEAVGVEVVEVVDGSPAADAGLKGATGNITVHGRELGVGGDVIVGIDGKRVRTLEDLLGYLAIDFSAGETVELEVIREGESRTVDLTLGERPSADGG